MVEVLKCYFSEWTVWKEKLRYDIPKIRPKDANVREL